MTSADALAVALAGGVLLAAGYLAQRYQRCPHCGRIVPRARKGWRRCAGCGRDYHRSTPAMR